MERRFYRKSNDKVLGGLCSGLAEYIGCNVIMVRLVTLICVLATGFVPGLVIYFICLILVPQDTQAGPDYHGYHYSDPQDFEQSAYPRDDYSYGAPPSGNGRYIVGIVFILLGIFLLARMFFAWIDIKYVIAGLLILGGVYMIFGERRGA
jgi:phage shock protein PspC (stress-responsive transcriptional regulator)